MKTSLYFLLKSHFVLKIFSFFPELVGHKRKQPDKKTKVNFNISDYRIWE